MRNSENKGVLLLIGIAILFVLVVAFFAIQKITIPSNSPPEPTNEAENCIVTGCSGQICAEEEIVTTCEYKEKYACYENATCERQESGECGWTMTEELMECLEQNTDEPSL